jgi:hypothetical protein
MLKIQSLRGITHIRETKFGHDKGTQLAKRHKNSSHGWRHYACTLLSMPCRETIAIFGKDLKFG